METRWNKNISCLHSHGFPNLFIISGPQGGGGQFNFTRVIDAHADYVVWMLEKLEERGAETVDIKQDAENAYAEHCREADINTQPLRDCISYYNGHGDGEPGAFAYYGGAKKCMKKGKKPRIYGSLCFWEQANGRL